MTSCHGLIFDCNFYFGSWPFAGNIYSCRPEVVVIGSTSSLQIVWGDHLDGLVNSDVRALNIENVELTTIPKDITIFFPNLIVLRWMNANLESIGSNDLQPFPNLVAFIFNQNLLSKLAGDLFQHAPLLNYIDLSENAIANVGVDLLSSLTHLIEVNFKENVCINTHANSPQSLNILKLQLSMLCGATGETTSTKTVSTTTIASSQECSADCLEQIRLLEEENAAKARRITQLEYTLRDIMETCMIPIVAVG